MPSTADYLRAEFIRSRGSALQWLPLIGLPLALMTVAFSQAAATGETAHAALGWQAMFVTGMAAPLTALFGAAPELREKAARGGGIDWRPCSPAHLRLARLAGVWTALGLFPSLTSESPG